MEQEMLEKELTVNNEDGVSTLFGSEAAESATVKSVRLNQYVQRSWHWLVRHVRSVGVVLIVLLAVGGLYYFRGVFVAAVVDGKPITRLSVIKELEKQSGQVVLDALITDALVKKAIANVEVGNEEIDKTIDEIEENIIAQGSTLQLALSAQGLTEDKFREQVSIQKKVRKLLAGNIQVTDEEVVTYIRDSKTVAPKGMSQADFRTQIKEQLEQQKFAVEAQKWIAELRTAANVKYFVSY